MIQRDEMFAPLLLADPGFTPRWEEFLAEWADEPEKPEYLALADLARYLVGKLASGDTDRFPAVFDVVERWVLEGDAYVMEAAVIGFLEDLQNANIHSTTEPDDFLRWVRPSSRRWWDKVEAFWRDGTLIQGD